MTDATAATAATEAPDRSALRRVLPIVAAWTLALTFLAVAVVSLGGRIAVAQLAGAEARVAEELGARLGLEVELGSLDGRFQVLHPVIDVTELRLRPPDADVAVHASRIQLEVDVLRSLLRRSLVPAALVVDDLSVALERSADGEVRLAGSVVQADVALTDVIEFFRTAGYVQFEAGELFLHREGGEGPDRLGLDGLLQYRWGEARGRLDLVYQAHDQERPATGSLYYRLRGDPLSGVIPRGHIELQMADLVLAERVADWWPEGPALSGELAVLDVIGELHPETGVRLDIDARADRLRVGASPTLENVELTLAASGLGAATGSLRLGRSAGEVDGVPLDLEGLEAHWRGLDDYPQVLLAAPGFASAPLLHVLLSTPGLPEMAERWLQGLAPEGSVRDARLLIEPGTQRFALAASVRDLHLDAYRGAPAVAGADLELVLFERGGWIDLESGPFGLHFPEVFPSGWDYQRGHGHIELAFGEQGVTVQGSGIEIVGDGVHAQGAFLLDLPGDEAERSFSLMLGIREAEAGRTREFLPSRMPAALRTWLVEAVRRGDVEQGGVVISGLMLPHLRGPLRPELFFDIAGGQLAFDPRWPIAEDIRGRLVVERGDFRGALASGRLGGLELRDVALHVPGLEGVIGSLSMRGAGRAPAAAGLDFLASMPVEAAFLRGLADWSSVGAIDLDYDLSIPLDGSALEHTEIGVDLDLEQLFIADLALDVATVSGRLEYQHPGRLHGTNLTGEVFSGPVSVAIEGGLEAEEAGLRIGLQGLADAQAVGVWTTVDALLGASGTIDYEVDLAIAPSGTIVLDFASDAEDLRTGLPEPVARGDGPLRMQLLAAPDDDWMLHYDWGSHAGAFRTRDQAFVAGSMGFGVDHPDLPEAGLVARGRIDRIDLRAWSDALADIEATAVARGRPPTRQRTAADLDVALEFAATAWDEAELGPASLAVSGSTVDAQFAIDSSPVAGRLRARIDEPLDLNIEQLRWPPVEAGDDADEEAAPFSLAGDAIDPARLVAMNVRIAGLNWHGEHVGSLAFELRPASELLVVDNILADLRGLEFGPDPDGRSRLEWRFGSRPQSRYKGRIFGSDSGRILEAWGVAPTLDTDAFAFDLDLAWPGAPMAFTARELDGRVRIEADRGRFVQVEAGTGPLRLIGLFNFAAIARRMRLDFTDVYQRGMAFDEIDGVLDFDSGRVRSARPLRILGPGSSFRIGAELDLVSEFLEGDIIVTLPVSRNLPWYAAYAILLANPITGAGVLVAERVFRDQIDRFSSARYRLRGTLEQPEVSFVSIFADEVDLPARLRPEDEPNLDWLLDDPFFWPDEYPAARAHEEDDS